MKSLSFLSTPYSHIDKEVEYQRYLIAIKTVAKLMNNNEFVFSPIVHCHEAAVKHGLPTDWEYWKDYCELMISKCDILYVLMLDGSFPLKDREIDISKIKNDKYGFVIYDKGIYFTIWLNEDEINFAKKSDEREYKLNKILMNNNKHDNYISRV